MADAGAPAAPDPRRLIPRTDVLLADPLLAPTLSELGRPAVKAAVVAAQRLARDGLLEPDGVAQRVVAELNRAVQDGGPATGTELRSVLNATGVVVHTNLGRAPLSADALQALGAAAGYTDVEFDVSTGRRAARGRSTLAALLAAVPAAEDALVVNNGAAALLLAVTALAAGREVLVSRGELVEIGDGFRLPELITATGARIREVGTTNRTRPADYADALIDQVAAIVKIHPSNFTMTGFTAAATVTELAALGPPLVVDIGSGLLAPDPALPAEPDAATALQAGADLVTCSGDKLLGGPQAGLVLGRRELVRRLRRHPLYRALRVDKLTLAALEATVRGATSPVAEAVHSQPVLLRERCELVVATLRADPTTAALDPEVVPADGAVGGGGAPGVVLPGWAVAVPERLSAVLRTGRPAVVGRVSHGRLLLDLRCVPAESDGELITAIRSAVAAGPAESTH